MSSLTSQVGADPYRIHQIPLIEDWQKRANFSLPEELLEVCTDGAYKNDAAKMTTFEIPNCFEESAWAFRVLKSGDDRLITLFIDHVISLKEKNVWYWPSVDAGGKNDKGEIFPSLAGRLADRLIEHAKLPEIAAKLSPIAREALAKVAEHFEAEIAGRRERYSKKLAELEVMVARVPIGPNVKKRIVHPLTTELIPKQVAERMFEIVGEDNKVNAFREFFAFVHTSYDLALAAEFVKATEDTVKKYSITYNNRIPENLEKLIEAGVAYFKTLQEVCK